MRTVITRTTEAIDDTGNIPRLVYPHRLQLSLPCTGLLLLTS